MLNGIGSSFGFTLSSSGTIQIMFIDSDQDANTGTGLVTVSPGGYSATVSATANVLRWSQGCHSVPAKSSDTEAGDYSLKLAASTLSGDGVIIRTPSEIPTDDHRYVMLNGAANTANVTLVAGAQFMGWFITSATSLPSGSATVEILQR